MNRSVGSMRMVLSISLGLGQAMAPVRAFAQSDPATQSLINQLQRRSTQTRGMVRPPSGSVTPEGVPAPAAEMVAPARLPSPAPRPVAVARPTTTAPAGVPAASITVNFASGSASLAPGAMSQLNILGRALTSAELTHDRFRIEGHTDTVGPAEENRLLSERRADSVRDYLVERFGVSRDRLVTEGMGESRLLVPTPDETAQAQNRRVQVLNLGS